MSNKISTIIDFQTTNAKSGLDNIRSAVDNAEGAIGKLKAGFGGLGDTVKGALAGPGGLAIAAGGIGAAAGAALDAVQKFSDLGVEIGNFATATGTSVDQASRWVEVAGDLKINAGDLEGLIGKMNKAAENTPQYFDEAGASIVRNKDHTVDANATFLNVIDTLKKIQDPAKQAALGAKLLGKGWQSAADLIGEGSDKIVERLKEVDKQKVFDDDKIKKAREYRDAMADLHDAFENITIELGQALAPAAITAAGDIGAIVKALDDVKGKFDELDSHKIGEFGLGKIVSDALNPISLFKDAVKGTKDAWSDHADTVNDKVVPSLDDLDRKYKTLADGSMGDAVQQQKDLADAADAAKRAAKMMTDSIELGFNRDKAALDALKGNVDDHAAWINLEQEFDQVKQTGVDAADAVANHTDDARAKTLDYAAALDGLKQHVIDYAAEVLKLPVEQVTKIVAAVDPQSLDEAEALLAALTRNRTVSLDIIAKGGAGYGGLSGARATGGPVSAGHEYRVDENGNEFFTPGTNGYVGPGGGGGINITVNAGIASDGYRIGQQVVNALTEYKRRTGRGI